MKLLLENTTLGHDQEEKYKDSQFKKSLEERVLKQTGYIGVATIRALSLAQCAAKKKKKKKKRVLKDAKVSIKSETFLVSPVQALSRRSGMRIPVFTQSQTEPESAQHMIKVKPNVLTVIC